MKSKEEIKIGVKRLEKLKQATIVHSLENIDLDNQIDLYDTMINLFAEGKLDNEFYSPLLQDMNESERKKLLEQGRKYLSLCFFAGDPNYWTDSIEGLSMMNMDLICMKIFDNYNFMLDIINDGGEDILKQLKKFQKTRLFSGNVVIDYLRNCFDDDKLLKSSLREVLIDDNDYSELTDYQKGYLFVYPEGVLFEEEKQEKKRISADRLKGKMIERISSKRDLSTLSLVEIAEILGDANFEEIVSDIYLDYTIDTMNTFLEDEKSLTH